MPQKDCCRLAMAYAMIKFCGSIRRSGTSTSLSLFCEKASTARMIYILFRDTFAVVPETQSITQNRLGRKHRYQVVVNDAVSVLMSVGLISNDGNWNLYGKPKRLKSCCKRAHITGAFLAAGSVSDPKTSYHLEFVTDMESDAIALKELLSCFGFAPKQIIRKDRYVVYLKEGSQISELLAVMGAKNALFSMENMLILKSVRNNVNRAVNCETANLSRTVDASVRHVENIRYLAENHRLAHLPPALREIAELRLQYPEANLQDLSELISQHISKSGINHRLRKLDQIACKLRQEKGEE